MLIHVYWAAQVDDRGRTIGAGQELDPLWRGCPQVYGLQLCYHGDQGQQSTPLLLLCSCNETFPAGHTLSCSLNQNRLCDLQSASDLEKNFRALFQAILQATVPPHGGRAWRSVTYRMFRLGSVTCCMFRLGICYLLHVTCCMFTLSRAQGAPETCSHSGYVCLCNHDMHANMIMLLRMSCCSLLLHSTLQTDVWWGCGRACHLTDMVRLCYYAGDTISTGA